MDGYNGHARPLDTLIGERGRRLLNVDNLKLARFKQRFPAAAKRDRIDTRKRPPDCCTCPLSRLHTGHR
jgi:hypothetical protein